MSRLELKETFLMKSLLIATYFYLFTLLSRLFFNLQDDKTKKNKKLRK